MLSWDWILHHLEDVMNKTTCQLVFNTVTLCVVLRHTIVLYMQYTVKSVTDRVRGWERSVQILFIYFIMSQFVKCHSLHLNIYLKVQKS